MKKAVYIIFILFLLFYYFYAAADDINNKVEKKTDEKTGNITEFSSDNKPDTGSGNKHESKTDIRSDKEPEDKKTEIITEKQNADKSDTNIKKSDKKKDIQPENKTDKKKNKKSDRKTDKTANSKTGNKADEKKKTDIRSDKNSDKIKKKTTDKKTEDKSGKAAEKKTDERIYVDLRGYVLNNRLLEIRKLLDDPAARSRYDLNHLITSDDGKKTTLLCDSVSLNYMDITEYLLVSGADINFSGADSGTPLHVAALSGNTAMIRFLLLKGAIIEAKDKTGNTPLLAALHAGNFEAANFLVMKGADTSAVNSSGSTVIIEAVTGGNIECVKLILAQNSKEVNRANSSGETPLYIAMKKNDTAIMRLLRDYGAADKRVVVTDPSIGELIEGTYTVKEYGKKISDYKKSADDTTVAYRYIFRRDGTGIIDMDDPARVGSFRWKVEDNALILEELDSNGYVTKKLRFLFLKTGGTVVFEKSEVQYGDVSGTRWEIKRAK